MAEQESAVTLCVLGCGNLGTAILTNLINKPPNEEANALPFTRFIACVRSEKSEQSLKARFPQNSHNLSISRGNNAAALQESDVVILAADPADIESVLTQPGVRDALASKLLISVAAGWTRQQLWTTLYGSNSTAEEEEEEEEEEENDDDDDNEDHDLGQRARIIRTLPNIAALVSQSLTAIELSDDSLLLPPPPPPADADLALTERIFRRIGRTVRVAPRLMDATTAVAGSTPALLAVIADALVDASVAVGVPRDLAGAMVFQAMRGTAAMLQDGVHPGVLKDRGTSPEGCTIGGLMVLEEAGVRGHVGRALREAVTVARLMGKREHLNDTRR